MGKMARQIRQGVTGRNVSAEQIRSPSPGISSVTLGSLARSGGEAGSLSQKAGHVPSGRSVPSPQGQAEAPSSGPGAPASAQGQADAPAKTQGQFGGGALSHPVQGQAEGPKRQSGDF